MPDEQGGNSEMEMSDLKVEATGHAEDKTSVGYNGGAPGAVDPMEELAAGLEESIKASEDGVDKNDDVAADGLEKVSQTAEAAVPAAVVVEEKAELVKPESVPMSKVVETEEEKMAAEMVPLDEGASDMSPIDPRRMIDETKVRTDPSLTESDKPTFNPAESQPALKDTAKEGGIVKTKTTGPTMSQPKLGDSGELLKPKADMIKDSLIGKFEITGFDVEYEVNGNTHTIAIRDYFDDLETAFASVNGDKYLMPMPGGNYKISTISNGAPTISFNERQVYNYKDEEWVRT